MNGTRRWAKRVTSAPAWCALMTAACAQAGTLRGTVLTAAGEPANGAKVWTAKLWTQPLDRRETRTDDQGRFRLELPPGDWLVWASLGSQSAAISRGIKVQASADPQPVTLTLAEWGKLRGRLLEAETGKPIIGGKLAIENGLIVTTDDQGRYEANALSHEGYHEAFVISPGRARMRVLFVMSDRPETELDVRVPRAGKIVGRVTDEQGRPIPGARVGRSSSGHSISTSALFIACDEQGRFEYEGISFDRPTRLEAAASGYQSQERRNLILDPRIGSLSLDFRLKREPEAAQSIERPTADRQEKTPSEFRDVTGTVLGPDGQPVPGAVVRWGVYQLHDAPQTSTGADGRFRLERVPDQPGVILIIPARMKLAPSFAFIRGRGEQDVRVELVQGRSAHGVVQDEQGTPFEDVSVIPAIPSPDPNRFGLIWLEELSARTDAHGRFKLSGLPLSGAKFDFLRNDLSPVRNQILELDGPENTVTLQASGAIQGRVVDTDGNPVRNFRVLLNGSRERREGDKFGGFFAGFCGIGLTYTSDDGSFVVKDLVAGSVQRLSIIAPGYGEGFMDRVLAEPVNHLSPPDALVIRLTPPHSLRVRVVEDGSNQPIAAARVALVYDDPSTDTNFAWGYHDVSWGDDVRKRTGPDGLADFTPLSFTEATLIVQAPGYGRFHAGWRDGSREVKVTMKPEVVLSGEVLDKQTGKPLQGVHIRLSSQAGEQITTSLGPSDQGRFRMTELPEGPFLLSVVADFGADLHREQVTLEAGKPLTRSFRLSKAEPRDHAIIAEPPKPRPPVKVLKLGEVAPEFAVKTPDGKPLALKDYRGKYVLLDFWATWCGPCIAELRHLRAVHETFGENPRFAMISLSLDASPSDVIAFLKGKNQPWPQAFLGPWAQDRVTKTYGIDAIPAVLLLDPEGKIIAQGLRGEAIKQAVAEALEPK